YIHDTNCQCEYLSFDAYINDTSTNKQYDWKYDLKACISIDSSIDQDCYIISQTKCDYFFDDDKCYQVEKCLYHYMNSDSIEVSLYVQTLDVCDMTASSTETVEICKSENGNCNI
uniref:Uncharacterized protein n=1 Tax=Amphimedon queenslandica TaxID=400682 RepID=A0A1X7TDF9_AMPQE